MHQAPVIKLLFLHTFQVSKEREKNIKREKESEIEES
jgi:hypothetical protein